MHRNFEPACSFAEAALRPPMRKFHVVMCARAQAVLDASQNETEDDDLEHLELTGQSTANTHTLTSNSDKSMKRGDVSASELVALGQKSQGSANHVTSATTIPPSTTGSAKHSHGTNTAASDIRSRKTNSATSSSSFPSFSSHSQPTTASASSLKDKSSDTESGEGFWLNLRAFIHGLDPISLRPFIADLKCTSLFVRPCVL